MKETELMIGDLVRYDTHLAEIISLNGDGTAYVLLRISETKKEKKLVEIKDLQPLHLTPNILKANNFKFIDGGWDQWWHYDPNDAGSDLQLYQNEIGFAIQGRIDIETNYVHELQHAFRMIKRDKTADNIKLI
jgi:hypothetical protein